MSGPEKSKRKELEERLGEVEQQLRSGMLARGFDPAQAEQLALTTPLARLYVEREQLQEEWPKVAQTTEQAWGDARKALRQAHDELVLAVSKLDEGLLDQPIVAGMSSVYVTLHGVFQHTIYHAGQIAILKKASS